jgi:hypothetical protein
MVMRPQTEVTASTMLALHKGISSNALGFQAIGVAALQRVEEISIPVVEMKLHVELKDHDND